VAGTNQGNRPPSVKLTLKDLVRRAATGSRHPCSRKPRVTRLEYVMTVFNIGSGAARQLCQKLELNPEELI
jgi:hypothetical protein